MHDITPNIEPSWARELDHVFQSESMKSLKAFLIEEALKQQVIYPRGEDMFAAFNLTPFDQVKVVILGQDPYHGDGQAHGLCFSVPQGIQLPPSLKNIFKELHADLGITPPTSGCLTGWAQQGVLLLNAILTVRPNQAASHRDKGWEEFTDGVIQTISQKRDHVVFILWGNYARSKKKLIDTSKHLIIESAHPSPLSAYNGFFGSKPFSRTNEYLQSHNLTPIEWGRFS